MSFLLCSPRLSSCLASACPWQVQDPTSSWAFPRCNPAFHHGSCKHRTLEVTAPFHSSSSSKTSISWCCAPEKIQTQNQGIESGKASNRDLIISLLDVLLLLYDRHGESAWIQQTESLTQKDEHPELVCILHKENL